MSRHSSSPPSKSFSDIGVEHFTAILIDGSKERFLPDLVTAGYDGGQRAASMIEKDALYFLQQQGLLNVVSHPNPTGTLIYIYADFQELGSFYTQANAITCPSDISNFVSGFDAYQMKGQAILGDVNMTIFRKERCLDDLLKILVSDHRCLDVILASSMRGAAVETLKRHENPVAVLVKLRFASFPDVFGTIQSKTTNGIGNHARIQHDEPLLASIVINRWFHRQTTRALIAPEREADTMVAQVEAPATMVYARNRRSNAESSLAAQSTALRLVKSEGHVQDTLDPKASILRDAKGRRLDPPLEIHESLVESIEGGRLCNNFHLKGRCPFRKCKYLHFLRDEKTQEERLLTAEEKETLRSMARRSPCKHGTTCDDPQCYAGHRCANHIEKVETKCSFPESMHFVVAGPVISEKRRLTWA